MEVSSLEQLQPAQKAENKNKKRKPCLEVKGWNGKSEFSQEDGSRWSCSGPEEESATIPEEKGTGPSLRGCKVPGC